MVDPQFTPQPPASVDPFVPSEVARRLEATNVHRAGLPIRDLVLLGLVGGVYIGFGGALATLVSIDTTLGYGLGRLASGLAFSLGLIMLVIAGGELFTGNNLMVLALASRKVSCRALLRNWAVAYSANAVGAIILAFAIHHSGIADNTALKAVAIKISEAKVQLGVAPAFLRGVLCNILVCLAIWLSVAARSVEGKVIAIALPISAFVALGFEHCIANFYLLPVGMLSGAPISYADFIGNIVPVTLGNTLGGVIVATVYYLVFLNSNHFARDSAVASPKPCSTSIGLLENLSTFVPLSRLAIWSGLYSEALRLGKHLRQRAALGALWRKNSRPGSTSRRQAS